MRPRTVPRNPSAQALRRGEPGEPGDDGDPGEPEVGERRSLAVPLRLDWLPGASSSPPAGFSPSAPGVPPPPMVPAAQREVTIVLVSGLTAALRASKRPRKVAPVVAVMVVSAITVPTNVEPVPNVAEEATC
jgi:hypothetical protein